MAQSENKKRKRHSNGVQTPNKKAAVEGNANASNNIKVNFVQNGSNPVIISASGLSVPSLSFDAYSRVRTPGQSNADVKPNTHELLLQSSDHPRLDYAASPVLDEPKLSHYVAIYDPSNGQLNITPAHRLGMSMRVRSEEEEAAQRKNIFQQKEALGREFGTKKARKALASRTENAITTDPKGKGKATDSQAALLDSVGETAAKITTQGEKSNAELLFESKPIPKPNLDADTVEEVYVFNTLVPAGESKQLQVKDWQDKIRANENIEFSHGFPAEWILTYNSPDDVLKIKALMYITLLIEFQAALGKGDKGSKKVPKKEVLAKRFASWPSQLVGMVSKRFSNESGFEMSKWHQDNLYAHICALALYLYGWTLDVSTLRDDLRMDTKQISQYFLELGCKVAPPTQSEQNARGLSKAKASNTRIARLKLPLEFPKPRKGKRQG